MLTIHTIVKDNEDIIDRMLDSIQSLNSQLLVGDMGCKDSTINKCLKIKAKIVRLHLENDLSKARIELLKHSQTKWNLYIEPWEFFLSGKELLEKYTSLQPAAYKFNILDSDLITKQIRLWHTDTKVYFKNPVFEHLVGSSLSSDVYLVSENKQINENILENWLKEKPLSSEPIYYKAFIELKKNNWDAFLNYASNYLYKEKILKKPVVMTYYYVSMVNCYIKNDLKKALEAIVPCLSSCPTMAEFWCLTGDIFYTMKDYKKAKSFYENAILLGCKRSSLDDYPIEISKYREYPEKMIRSCQEINKNINFYISNTKRPNDLQ